jgi:hypothetical protein
MVGLTNWVSLIDSVQHIGFVDGRGHVLDLYIRRGDESWAVYDVTEDTGPPLADRGALTSWWSDPIPNVVSGQQHVAYIDGRGHVEEVFVTPGSPPWNIRDVTDDIGAPAGHWAQGGALTTWFSIVDGLRHIAYIDQRGHLQDCYMRPGEYPWQNYDVTLDPFNGPWTAQAGALSGWWSPSDNTQHITFIDNVGPDLLHDTYVVPGQPPWVDEIASSGAHLGDAWPGALTTWWSPSDDRYHIGYIGDDPGPWPGHLLDVSAPPPSPGDPLYPYWNWAGYDATKDAGPPTAQLGQGTQLTSWWSTIDGRQHMAYIDGHGHIQDISVVPGQLPWGNYDATRDAGAPAARGDAITSWWSPRDNTQHIAYIDANTHVQELWVVPGRPPWHLRADDQLIP